jgi:(1->4)-alpha-D-glucan 1-alpha-D-glucosylmutase
MHIPRATYRIQFNPSFGFQQARKIVSYLAELGISDLYASPIFQARKGSLHGYDVVDQNEINPDLGTDSDYEELTAEVRNYELGWLQDIVPNHMAYSHENTMLMDVFENGQASDYYTFFDVEWEHPYEGIRGRVLAPFLGSFFGEALEKGEIKLLYDENGLRVTYYNLSFPLKIESYSNIFTHQLEGLKQRLGNDHPELNKLLGIVYLLRNLSSRDECQERYDQVAFVKRMLWELYSTNEQIERFVDTNIAIFNGDPLNPLSFNLLDNLLSEQHFRLSFWKVAAEEINYRRFFNINDLISLKIEDDVVFNHTHALIFSLLKEKKITGLRIDHIDGLYDPTRYLAGLRETVGPIYILAEKILEFGEQLPMIWPIQGTTGYDYLNYVNGVFCKGNNESKISGIYSRFAKAKQPFEQLLYDKKKLILEKHMAGDVDNLANLLKRVSSRDRHGGDITLYGLKTAMVEILSRFPVYRSYISDALFREEDRLTVNAAIDKTLQHNPGLMHELRFIKRFLLLESGEYLSDEEKRQRVHFVMRFQQFTGPLMAKGFEDTTLYICNRLLSLNEVGGFPNTFGISLEEFHAFNTDRNDLWPHSLNATSTHDTKRGEDVRARLNVISELPEEWEANIRQWSKINRKKKRKIGGLDVPDKNDEYFIYQTLVGSFPSEGQDHHSYVARIKSYLIKAVREAKVHTAWIKPDHNYEEGCLSFVEQTLQPSKENRFFWDFRRFQKKVAYYGTFNSLSQALIKITSPGVPDFYQGSELWDLNLVDPDNRRPVDFGERMRLLKSIKDRAQVDKLHLVNQLLDSREDGAIKLFVIHQALTTRNEISAVFERGQYIPLEVRGRWRNHVVAFARSHGRRWAVTIAPRFLTRVVKEGEYPLGYEVWQDTRVVLPAGADDEWDNPYTGEALAGTDSLPVGKSLKNFPVALLIGRRWG